MCDGGVCECGTVELGELQQCHGQQTEDHGRLGWPQLSNLSLLAFWQRLLSDYSPNAGKELHLYMCPFFLHGMFLFFLMRHDS